MDFSLYSCFQVQNVLNFQAQTVKFRTSAKSPSLGKCTSFFNYRHDSARTHVWWQPCPIPAAITEYRATGRMEPVENGKKKKRGSGGLFGFQQHSVHQSVSQSVASHQARINPPPRSLLSRQTVTDVLRYRAIIYQPPRVFNPWRFTRRRHGKGSECDRSLKSEIAISVEHGQTLNTSTLQEVD